MIKASKEFIGMGHKHSHYPFTSPHSWVLVLQPISLTKTTKQLPFWQNSQLLPIGNNFVKTWQKSWRTPGKQPKPILLYALKVIVRGNSRCLPVAFLLGMVKSTCLHRNQGTSRPITTNMWSNADADPKSVVVTTNNCIIHTHMKWSVNN